MHSSFSRPLAALAIRLELEHELADLSTGEAFERLRKLAHKPEFARQLKAEGVAELARTSALLKGVTVSMELKREVISVLFAHLLTSMAYRGGANPPRVHHWLPLCYLSRFSRHSAAKAGEGRGAVVHKMDWASGEALEHQVSDVNFTHGVDARGKGFYDPEMEKFFSLLEGAVAQEFSNNGVSAKQANSLALHMAFFVAQTVRNPSPTEGFSLRTVAELTEAMEAVLDALPEFYCAMGKVPAGTHMVFSPFLPTRTRRLADGTLVRVYAVGPKGALTVAPRVLTPAEADAAAIGAHHAAIAHARRTGSAVYGLRHSDARH